MKLYYLIGRLLSPVAILSLIAYSRIFGTKRVRVILENEQKEILLIKTWLSGSRWGLPGGGIEKGESPAAAASRELHEETGIVISEDLLSEQAKLKNAGHHEIIFRSLTASSLPKKLPNRLEVKEAGWFTLIDLPPLDPLAEKILSDLAKKG